MRPTAPQRHLEESPGRAAPVDLVASTEQAVLDPLMPPFLPQPGVLAQSRRALRQAEHGRDKVTNGWLSLANLLFVWATG